MKYIKSVLLGGLLLGSFQQQAHAISSNKLSIAGRILVGGISGALGMWAAGRGLLSAVRMNTGSNNEKAEQILSIGAQAVGFLVSVGLFSMGVKACHEMLNQKPG